MKTSSNKENRSGNVESKSMNELFENQLRDIYWAEQELTRFMPELVREVYSSELRNTLEQHMKVTEQQLKRVEKIFKEIGSKPQAEECPAMAGLVEEARHIVKSARKGVIRDAFIIGAVQKVEHYEMASYGTMKAIANLMGEFEVASLLDETLQEEKEADEQLTDVAENIVNVEASREAGELEPEQEEEEIDEALDQEEEEENEGFESRGSQTKPKSKSKSKSKSKEYQSHR